VRPGYRLRQFRLALTALPDPQDLALARQVLTPPLMELFLQMQASDQAPSLWIFRKLVQTAAQNNFTPNKDLLAAALLHDMGKTCHPDGTRHRLHVWNRAAIVLGKALFPGLVKRWRDGPLRGWKRAFVIAEQHPVWGAALVEQAGAAPQVAALIRRHHESLEKPAVNLEDQLLVQLQRLDEER
jgi:putative nucleotidyltransferase with HDIG domain